MLLPRSRAYVDWKVPLDKDGNEIGVCRDNETFNYYIDWLADYLFITEIPVPESQQDLVADFESQKGIERAVFWLSDDWGYSMLHTEYVEESYLEGWTFERYHQFELEEWNDMAQDYKDLYEDNLEEFFISEADFHRIGREVLEEKKNVPKHIRHSDIAYRAVFASLLKKVINKEERIMHLRYFYENLNTNAYK